MAAVSGASPVTFISEDTEPGTQFQVPLALLTVADGVVDASAWKPAATLKANDTAILERLLSDLLAQGVIAPAST